MRRVPDAVMAAFARGLIRVFFRELEVTGAVPPGGPTILVANHQNGLVDGLVLMAALGRYPRFLGKSTLWKIVPLRPFLALAGVVPIYRGADTQGPSGPMSGRRGSVSSAERLQRNDEAFARCRHLLAEGGMVAVFPEGISHDESQLQQLRSGAARIALGAAGDDAVDGVVIVPAGLVYDDKSRFRSRALVRVGPPRPVAPAVPGYLADPADGIHALTAEVARDLRTVAPDFASWELADRALAVAALLVPDLAERSALADRLAGNAHRPAFERVADAAARYHQDLAVLGLDDEAVTAPPRNAHNRMALLWSGIKVAVAAPLAGAGVAVHLVPYYAVKVVARRPTNVGMRATVKLGGCFGLFTLTYLGIAVRVGTRRGWRPGMAAFVAAPTCGYVAVVASERLDRMGGAARGVRALRDHQATVSALRARRAEAVAGAVALLAAGP